MPAQTTTPIGHRWRTAAIMAICLLALGCAGSFHPGVPNPVPADALTEEPSEAGTCVRYTTGGDESSAMMLGHDETDEDISERLAEVPVDVRRTVRAAGLEPALAQLLRDRASNLPELEMIVRRHTIGLRLQLLKVQIDATTFEADCTGELLEGLQASLDQEQGERELRWTVASIVTGSVAAAGAGAWDLAAPDSKGPAITGLVGGLAAGAMGLAAIAQPEREIVLDHERNLMTPIITGRDPGHFYPTFVFNLLTFPKPSGPTPREALRTRLDAILDGAVEPSERKRAAALVYGAGGVYDRRLLDARETMLDEVERAIAALSRDLEVLSRYLWTTFGR